MKIKTNDGEELHLEFADEFFESFPGTDEELQELLVGISEAIKDGSFFDEVEPFDVQYLDEDEADELMAAVESRKNRTIQ